MGIKIKAAALDGNILNNATTPIVFCVNNRKFEQLVTDSGYNPININIRLAEALLKYPNAERANRANDEMMFIISQCTGPVYFENYEMLLDPRYNINVIKVFVELARWQKVVIKWCGEIHNNTLEYSTPGYRDYHSFNIEDYNITCIV